LQRGDPTRQTDYSVIAAVYDRRYRHERYAETARALDAFLGQGTTNLDVLDAGCGTGYWISRLAAGRRRIVGLDASAEMLGRARSQNKQCLCVRALAETLPFENATFDRIFAVNSLHHFTDKVGFMRQARRVLRPGGGIMTIGLDPHSGLDHWWVYDYFTPTLELDRQRYLPAGKIRKILAAEGFSDCRTQVVQHFRALVSAGRALERGSLARTVTSQLAILEDREYERGIERIREDISTCRRQEQELLIISDVRLYETTAWLK
jgi:ubiquinone/menaquinone biosynthesis C-methylase UbiE